MQRGFRIEPGSAARSAEQEKKAQGPVPSFRIGSAAKSAEERAKASEDTPREPFRSSVGVRMSIATGQKFELPVRPSGPGEAQPVQAATSPEPVPQAPAGAPPSAPSAAVSPEPQGLSRLLGKFRGLFGK